MAANIGMDRAQDYNEVLVCSKILWRTLEIWRFGQKTALFGGQVYTVLEEVFTGLVVTNIGAYSEWAKVSLKVSYIQSYIVGPI